jgi:hypothetical protein
MKDIHEHINKVHLQFLPREQSAALIDAGTMAFSATRLGKIHIDVQRY